MALCGSRLQAQDSQKCNNNGTISPMAVSTSCTFSKASKRRNAIYIEHLSVLAFLSFRPVTLTSQSLKSWRNSMGTTKAYRPIASATATPLALRSNSSSFGQTVWPDTKKVQNEATNKLQHLVNAFRKRKNIHPINWQLSFASKISRNPQQLGLAVPYPWCVSSNQLNGREREREKKKVEKWCVLRSGFLQCSTLTLWVNFLHHQKADMFTPQPSSVVPNSVDSVCNKNIRMGWNVNPIRTTVLVHFSVHQSGMFEVYILVWPMVRK